MSADPYVCADGDARRRAVLDSALNGIDHVEVDETEPGPTLLVHCLQPLMAIPKGLSVAGLGVSWALRAPDLAGADSRLVTAADVARFGAAGDRVCVVRSAPPPGRSSYRVAVDDPGFDPRLSAAGFSFGIDCDDIDCADTGECPPAPLAEPVIDYLSRDFTGLRQLLLDRLSVVTPSWTDRNVADVGVMLVEIFAYLGDHLAAAQDAVAAEAYLGTARRRISLARHARLLDYPMHQGAAARVWLALEIEEEVSDACARLNACTPPGQREPMLPAGHVVRSADGTVTFHTLADADPRHARNAIKFHTWSSTDCCLPVGATSATLVGTAAGLGLHKGDVLILEEIRGADPGVAVEVTHRWPVRLDADPEDERDQVLDRDVVNVSWYEADALPFALCCRRIPQGRCFPDEPTAVARGNVVLAGHGDERVGPAVPAVVPVAGRYRPALDRPGLAYAVPYDDLAARTTAAAAALQIDPRRARAEIVAVDDGRDVWTRQTDLLGSDRFAADYVVETAEDGFSYLRFGDGISGRAPTPGRTFCTTYQIGGGSVGNVGREVLTVLEPAVTGVSVRNPMAAVGGADPEPAEQVRQFAPQAFREQERAVTDDDYARLVMRDDPRVQRAVGTRRWTGSWYTEYVTVDRRGGLPVAGIFADDLQARLDRYRMAGGDVSVSAPVFVPLEIVLTVCVRPGYFGGTVKKALVERFSSREQPGGKRGFFHPDNFTFAQPVYLSAVVAAAMSVAGVAWVDFSEGPDSPNRFQRLGQPPDGELAAGRITMGRLEVARCDSRPVDASAGRIDFVMTGGL
jgi:hypothetical protein